MKKKEKSIIDQVILYSEEILRLKIMHQLTQLQRFEKNRLHFMYPTLNNLDLSSIVESIDILIKEHKRNIMILLSPILKEYNYPDPYISGQEIYEGYMVIKDSNKLGASIVLILQDYKSSNNEYKKGEIYPYHKIMNILPKFEHKKEIKTLNDKMKSLHHLFIINK